MAGGPDFTTETSIAGVTTGQRMVVVTVPLVLFAEFGSVEDVLTVAVLLTFVEVQFCNSGAVNEMVNVLLSPGFKLKLLQRIDVWLPLGTQLPELARSWRCPDPRWSRSPCS